MDKPKVILADPAWDFKVYSDKGKGRSAENHYETMTLEEIKKLPVNKISDDECMLFLWITGERLPDGIDVMNSWGFDYKSVAFVWYKIKKDMKKAFKDLFGGEEVNFNNIDYSKIDFDRFFRISLGYNTRKQTEICLLGSKKVVERQDKSVRQVIAQPEDIFEAIGEHSAKPHQQYDRIEKLYNGPYLELFGRKERTGWTTLGYEINGKDIRDELERINEEIRND